MACSSVLGLQKLQQVQSDMQPSIIWHELTFIHPHHLHSGWWVESLWLGIPMSIMTPVVAQGTATPGSPQQYHILHTATHCMAYSLHIHITGITMMVDYNDNGTHGLMEDKWMSELVTICPCLQVSQSAQPTTTRYILLSATGRFLPLKWPTPLQL